MNLILNCTFYKKITTWFFFAGCLRTCLLTSKWVCLYAGSSPSTLKESSSWSKPRATKPRKTATTITTSISPYSICSQWADHPWPTPTLCLQVQPTEWARGARFPSSKQGTERQLPLPRIQFLLLLETANRGGRSWGAVIQHDTFIPLVLSKMKW